MPINAESMKLLESYRDKAYITSILCSQSENTLASFFQLLTFRSYYLVVP